MNTQKLIDIYTKFNNTEYSEYLIVIMSLFGNSLDFFRETYYLDKKQKKENNPKKEALVNFIKQFLSDDTKNITKINVNIDSNNIITYFKKILKLLDYYDTKEGEISECIFDEEIRIEETLRCNNRKRFNSKKIICDSVLLHDIRCSNIDYIEKGIIINKSLFYEMYNENINLPLSWDDRNYKQFLKNTINDHNNYESVIEFFSWLIENHDKEVYTSIKNITDGYEQEIDIDVLKDISVKLNNLLNIYNLDGYHKYFLSKNTNCLIVPVNKKIKNLEYNYKYNSTFLEKYDEEIHFDLCSVILKNENKFFVALKFNEDEWFLYKDSKLHKLLEYKTFFNQNIGDIKVVIYDKN